MFLFLEMMSCVCSCIMLTVPYSSPLQAFVLTDQFLLSIPRMCVIMALLCALCVDRNTRQHREEEETRGILSRHF